MFATGTKTIVIASSLNKKVGPRVGSIGYIINSDKGHYNSSLNLSYSLINTIFINYGFEQTFRHEHRVVLNTFPFSLHKINPKTFVKDACSMINKINVNKGSWKNVLEDFSLSLSCTVSEIVFLAPIQVNNTNLFSCSKNEFCAWFDSYLRSYQFLNSLKNAMNKGLRNNLFPFNTDAITEIRACAADKKRKHKVFNEIDNTNSFLNRKLIIQVIKILQTIQMRSELKNKLFELELMIQENRINDGYGSIRSSLIPLLLIDDIYINAFQKAKYDMLSKLHTAFISNALQRTTKIKEEIRTFTEPVYRKKLMLK